MRRNSKIIILIAFLVVLTAELPLLPRVVRLTQKKRSGVVVVHDTFEETAGVPQEADAAEEETADETAEDLISILSIDPRAYEDKDIIFVGDSRTVQMQSAVGDRTHKWIAEARMGYYWFADEALPEVNRRVSKGTHLIINMGVNDITNADKYIKKINAQMNGWREKGVTVYYASVNPVRNYPDLSNERIDKFNEALQAELDPGVIWIDSNSWLKENGYSTADGLHYRNNTYMDLYAFYLSFIEETDVSE